MIPDTGELKGYYSVSFFFYLLLYMTYNNNSHMSSNRMHKTGTTTFIYAEKEILTSFWCSLFYSWLSNLWFPISYKNIMSFIDKKITCLNISDFGL